MCPAGALLALRSSWVRSPVLGQRAGQWKLLSDSQRCKHSLHLEYFGSRFIFYYSFFVCLLVCSRELPFAPVSLSCVSLGDRIAVSVDRLTEQSLDTQTVTSCFRPSPHADTAVTSCTTQCWCVIGTSTGTPHPFYLTLIPMADFLYYQLTHRKAPLWDQTSSLSRS